MPEVHPPEEVLCPHCLRRAQPAPNRREMPAGVAECGLCHESFVPLADGAAAVLLTDDVTVHRDATAFVVCIGNAFSLLGVTDRALEFRLEAERFVWSRPALALGIELSADTESVPRASIRRFEWRSFEIDLGHRSQERWSDLVIVLGDGAARRAGFKLPSLWRTGTTIATILQWALESVLRPEAALHRLPE